MTTEYDIQSRFFNYVSHYLESNGEGWSINNLPRCCPNSKFTFDTRKLDAPIESPLFVIHNWNYVCPAPTKEQLLAITPEQAHRQKRLIHALRNKADVILATNQMRLELGLQNMTNDQIVALAPENPPF